jgi:hypothetical protein
MGLCNSPDIFQEKISDLMYGLEFARAYLDDLLIISKNSFQEHLDHLEEVFTRLQEAGLKINASKSAFCTDQLEYLGYVINRQGIQSAMKKVAAMLRIETPKTRKQLRGFIGMVNYYRDMWPQRSHIMAPLTALTSSSVKWKWTKEHQEAFEQIKKQIAKETLLAYPDFSKDFHIHSDASKLQLGAWISQDNRPIAFYSRKLTDAQTRYTTTDREMLSIVETLKEFRTILLGQKIIIHTDHKNLTFGQLTSERVMRWRLYLEEYSPDISYIKGEQNVVADALSRLPYDATAVTATQEAFLSCFTNDFDDLGYHPLSYAHLHVAQQADLTLMKILQMEHSLYHLKDFLGGRKTQSLVCFKGKNSCTH